MLRDSEQNYQVTNSTGGGRRGGESMEPRIVTKRRRKSTIIVRHSAAMAKKEFLVVDKIDCPSGFTGWCFSCKATVRLPLLPGGATILCHFWNNVVFKQSRGDNAYALCLDISSCIGSRITHNCKKKCTTCIKLDSNELHILFFKLYTCNPISKSQIAKYWRMY